MTCSGSRRTPTESTQIDPLGLTCGRCRTCAQWQALALDGTVRTHDARSTGGAE